MLLAFVGGSVWKQHGLSSLAARRAAVLEGFADLLGDQALRPVAIMRPGTLTTYGQELRRPHARTHLAGPATSTYWNSYMDGAVRSGKRAAAEVLRLL